MLKKLGACVAHTWNPNYSGGRDQEDHGLKSAQPNRLQDPILKKPITIKDWWSDSRCRPWVQTPAPQKKKKERKKKKKKSVDPSLALVAHTYNPSYLGGRDQEDLGSRPTLGK
jgi:hypothetical protein